MDPNVRLYSGTVDPIAFYNKCHDEDGRFCEGEDGPGRSRDNFPKPTIPLRPVDKKGFSIARGYHKNQADKQGKDYVSGHLTQVGASLPPDLAMAGWLHDAIEDAGATPESLARDGIDSEIIRIVKAVTTDGPNSNGKGDMEYPDRIRAVIAEGGPKAARVKLSDLSSNNDPFRPRDTPPKNPNKYPDAIKQVEDYLKDADPVLYQDYLDRVKNRPGWFDWSKVRYIEGNETEDNV